MLGERSLCPNCGAQDTVAVPPFPLKASLEMVDRTRSPTTQLHLLNMSK
jgi:hypothetical protein